MVWTLESIFVLLRKCMREWWSYCPVHPRWDWKIAWGRKEFSQVPEGDSRFADNRKIGGRCFYLFCWTSVNSSTALPAHHPNKSERVCGFHALLSGSCHGRPDGSHHNKTLSLFIPVTSRHRAVKRCLGGFRGRDDLQSLRERQAHSMPRTPSLQGAKRYSGRLGTSRAGLQWRWQGRWHQWERVGTSPGYTSWTGWRLGVNNGYLKKTLI